MARASRHRALTVLRRCGGNFDYWPEGIEGPMISERTPFGNVALCADTDQIYHRIGLIGDGPTELSKMSAGPRSPLIAR